MFEHKTLLITGGAGFVGSNISIKFKADNPSSRVISFDNLKRRGSELNLSRLKEAGVEFVHGDVRNKEDLATIGPFDIMIECSAEPSVLAGYDGTPEYLLNTNLVGTLNCLEAVRKNGAELIFLSTSRVYPIHLLNKINLLEEKDSFKIDPKQTLPGISERGISESFPLEGARSLYGATKLCSEVLIQEYCDAYNIKAVINRCGIITGPYQMGKVDQGVIVFWLSKHLFGGSLEYIGYGGKGKQVRDILHVEDLYNLLVIELTRMDKLSGQVFNVGGGNELSLSLKELTSICEELTGNKILVGNNPINRKGDIPLYITDTSLIHKFTGWFPKKTKLEIFSELKNWMVSEKETLRNVFI